MQRKNTKMEIIPLFNRYKDKNILEFNGEDYTLKTKYNRIRYSEIEGTDKIQFVDPSGGPFMKIGESLSGKAIIKGADKIKIESIYLKEGEFHFVLKHEE